MSEPGLGSKVTRKNTDQIQEREAVSTTMIVVPTANLSRSMGGVRVSAKQER